MTDDKKDSGHAGNAALTRIAPVVLTLLLLVKVYAVAWFSLETATALVVAAPLSVLLGTLALYEYVFMAAVTAIAVLLFFMGMLKEGDLRRWTPFTLVLAVFSALLTPLFYLPWAVLTIVIALAIYATPRFWGRWRRMRIGQGKALPTLGRITMILGAVIVAGAVLVTVDKPWLPAEVVDLRKPVFVNPQKHTQASRPVVFVVSEQDGWVTMLVNYDRYLLRVPSTDVVKRRVCHLNWQLGNGRTLYQWLTRQPYHAAGLACWRLTDLRHQETAPGKPSTGPDS